MRSMYQDEIESLSIVVTCFDRVVWVHNLHISVTPVTPHTLYINREFTPIISSQLGWQQRLKRQQGNAL